MFREALQRLLAKDLRCPRCPAMNRPAASDEIDVDQTGTRAQCNACNCEGPIERFQPKKETR